MLARALLFLALVSPLFGARDFPGNSTDKITAVPSLSGSTMSFSALIWIDSAGSSGFGNLVRPRGNTANVVYVNATDIVFEADFTGADGQWGCTRPSTGAWHHFGLTYNGSLAANDPIMYIDGTPCTLVGDSNPTGNFTGAGIPFFGNNNAGTTGFDGRMAEVAIWSVIRTASNMAGLAKRASPVFYSDGLEIYIPMLRENVDWFNAAPTVLGTTVVAHPQVIYPAMAQVGIAAVAVAPSPGPVHLRLRRREAE